MNKLIINGGVPLSGRVRVSGSKNAVLPIMAGTLLADSPVIIRNVPHLHDVTTTMELLGRMGVMLTIGEKMSIEVDPTTLQNTFAPYSRQNRDRTGRRISDSDQLLAAPR